MSILPIGASSVAALVLSKLTGNSSSTSDTDDLSSLLGSSQDTLSISPEAQSAWSAMQSSLQNLGQNGSNPMQKDLEKLNSLISVGDLTGASTLFQGIQDKFKSHGKSGTGISTSGGSSTLDSEFSALQAALKSGDVEAAKATFATLQSDLQKAPPPLPPPPSSQSSSKASSGVSDLDVLLLSSYWNYPGLTSKSSTSEIG